MEKQNIEKQNNVVIEFCIKNIEFINIKLKELEEYKKENTEKYMLEYINLRRWGLENQKTAYFRILKLLGIDSEDF